MSTQSREVMKKTVMCALMGALLFALQITLSFLPNIEVVSVLIAVYAVVFGFWALPSIYIFALLEGLFFGFDIWWITYLYVWAILFFVAYLCRKIENSVFWGVILGFFGLFFGSFCAVPTIIVGGLSAGISWWISGILFDIIHCVSNIIIGFVLFTPLKKALIKIRGRM